MGSVVNPVVEEVDDGNSSGYMNPKANLMNQPTRTQRQTDNHCLSNGVVIVIGYTMPAGAVIRGDFHRRSGSMVVLTEPAFRNFGPAIEVTSRQCATVLGFVGRAHQCYGHL